MAKTVKLSRLKALGLTQHEFAMRVARMVEETKAWRDHMAEVIVGRAQSYPAPTDIGDVMAAVEILPDGSVSTDYVVEDDTPKPADLLPAKKVNLANFVLALESRLNESIEPSLRVRKNVRLVSKAERKRSPEDQSIIDTITAKGDSASNEEKDLLAFLKGKPRRTPKDETVLAARDQRAAMRDQLDEWVADKLAEIDDLTVDDIDSWSPGEPPIQVE